MNGEPLEVSRSATADGPGKDLLPRREGDPGPGDVLPGRIAIIGFARSGRALARALVDRGVEVLVGDSRSEAAFEGLEDFRGLGVRFFFDGPPPDFWEGADWLALSPGVPRTSPAVVAAAARGLPVLAELEIAWRIAQSEAEGAHRWIAVTGTNGKSTTATWIADILGRAGRPVSLAGNIGIPLSALLSDRAPRDFVCEVSSFQLEALDRFSPRVAVLTNVTPDHLDRYADFSHYARTKGRLFARQSVEDFSVVNVDDAIAAKAPTVARRVPFSRAGRAPGGVWVEGGRVCSEVGGSRREVIGAGEISLAGAHNLENALAAVAVADCLGAPEAAVREGLRGFSGLPHRSELVASGSGIRWVDDSKGTNVDATRKSLEAYPGGSVLLILGGRDKHGDFPALAAEVSRAARLILTIGEAAETIERALSGAVSLERAGTMERAVARAAELARAGDTVLLSPACASFDAYENFEERGRHFAGLARAAAAGRRHGA